MTRFDEKINQILLETPWYDIKLEIPIDLKFEKCKTKEDIIERIKFIVNDENNRLYIKDNLIIFIRAVLKDNIFLGFVKKYDCMAEVKSMFRDFLRG